MYGTTCTFAGLIMTAAAGLALSGKGTAERPRHALADTRGGEPPCPTIAEIRTAVGFPVQARSVPVDGCMYELTGRHRGAMITLMYQPATRANDIFAAIKHDVKVKGAGAQPDRLSLGEGGWGYSGNTQQEAAVVSQGRLYHVKIGAPFFSSLKLPDDAALRVIKLGIRAAPGAHTASSGGGPGTEAAIRDACTLATNAEVAQVAEEKPELVRFWSAPVASFGGTHCSYGGGSVRLYQGKAAAADFESTLKTFKVDQGQRIPVGGIGEKAFFMALYPDDEYKRAGLLAVYAGSRVLMLTLDPNGDELVAATRPRLERFAKLVLPRLP